MTVPVKGGKLSGAFECALSFAAWRHADHVRKGTDIPYIAHLLGVASIALEHGANESEAIAALLHDAVEDGAADLAEIRRRFGAEVADIVEACSDTVIHPKPPWRERKERYIAHIRTAPLPAQLVSASDKLHNARAILNDYRQIGEKLWGRFNATRDETLWYYRALVCAFRHDPSSRLRPLIDELDRVVGKIERLVHASAAVTHEPN